MKLTAINLDRSVGVTAIGFLLGSFFALVGQEDYAKPIALIACLLLLCLGRYLKKEVAGLLLCLGCLSIALGYQRTQIRMTSTAVERPDLTIILHEVSGLVSSVRRFPKHIQFTLSDIDSREQLRLTKLRVNCKKKTAQIPEIGDRIRFSSVRVTPIQRPAAVDAYDFARYSYFERISATSTTYSIPELLYTQHPASKQRVAHRLRQRLIQYTQQYTKHGALLIAITTGDKSLLTEVESQEIRRAGLSHVLAVSGFHLSILTTIVFWCFQGMILVAILVWKREKWYPYQCKISAVCTVLFGILYLEFTASPISAKRAYIMVVLHMVAILSGRLASSTYSIALTTILLLLFTPEAILHPGFQLSFLATLTIIATQARLHTIDMRQQFWFTNPFLRVLLMNILHSLAITLTIAPITAYHFNTINFLSILSNLVTLPLVTLILVPSFLLCLSCAALPNSEISEFITQSLFYIPDYTAYVIKSIAHFVATMRYACVSVPQISITQMAIFSVCMTILLIVRDKTLQKINLMAMIICLLTVLDSSPPDMQLGIQNNGKMIITYVEDGVLFIASNHRENFLIHQWQEQYGNIPVMRHKAHTKSSRKKENDWIILKNKKILILHDFDTVKASELEAADLVILPSQEIAYETNRPQIDYHEVQEHGTYQIWADNRGLHIRHFTEQTNKKPWYKLHSPNYDVKKKKTLHHRSSRS